MYKVGWITDKLPPHHGRNISIQHFRESVPEGLEIVDIDLTAPQECDVYVCHSNAVPKNLPLFPKSLKPGTSKLKKVVMYAHQWELWAFGANTVIYQSPLHASVHKFGTSHVIPPPILESDYKSENIVERTNQAIWCGYANKEEGFDIAVRWAETTKTVTNFFGAAIPMGNETPQSHFRGWAPHDQFPDILQSHSKMIYFPREPRPFDRMLAEALLAGLEVEVWGKLGIESFEAPLTDTLELCKTSTERFWEVVSDNIN